METLWLDNLFNTIETIGIIASGILTALISYLIGCFVINKFFDDEEDEDDD